MVNKDMNGFPVKKCSAFQFFKKRVRRWIKSPMVNVEKHPHASLKYPGSTVMNLPAGDSELEPPFCQTCLSDHPFQRGIGPQEAESCSWESQRNSKMKDPQSKGDSLPKTEPRTLWGGEDTVTVCEINDTMPCPLSGLGHVYLQLQLCLLKRLCPAAHHLADESSHMEICQLIQGLVTPTMWVLMSRCRCMGAQMPLLKAGKITYSQPVVHCMTVHG
ncbi:uncharacterized protein LOC128804943 [Vidua macroura]|uniref:uncharacterized protein LOC128804943 n=1 Tax=Vidua macroura TaxID=187451 RepID=UPI0023A8A6DB|nr:uncharacterized protein LOC128804943 [Vidua macroura]